MASIFQLSIKRLQFYLKAANSKGHGTHSPFVYHFITEILNDNRYFYAFGDIEPLKNELLRDKRKINYYGQETTVASIMQASLPAKYNQLLFRMVDFYKPSYIQEIGGSLGITTAYLSSPDKTKTVYTFQFNKQLEMVAQQTLKTLNLHHAISISKEQLLEKQNKNRLIVINHPHWDTEDIIPDLSTLLEEESVLILTGINISLNKKMCWNKIVEQSMKTFSIELFDVGIIFFRKEVLKKQHFAIRF